jgi:hypothetical protein
MTVGILSNALLLAQGNAWAGNLTFSFRRASSPSLIDYYQGISLGNNRSATLGGTVPNYLDVYDETGVSAYDENITRFAFNNGLESFINVQFSEVTTGGNIAIGSLNHDVPRPNNTYTLAWVQNIGAVGNIFDGAVWLTQNGQSGGFGSSLRPGFYLSGWVLPHEIGHALGLIHPSDASEFGVTSNYPVAQNDLQFTIMAYGNHPTENSPVFDYQLYDIAALQKLYGRNETHNAGSSVYSIFHESAPINGVRQFGGDVAGSFDRIFSIWDGGGIDSIDASAYSTSAYIDLRPGHFSSIGPDAFTNNGPFLAGTVNNNNTITLGSNGSLGRENMANAVFASFSQVAGDRPVKIHPMVSRTIEPALLEKLRINQGAGQ